MIDTSLMPQALTPNYEQPYEDVYREYAKYLISMTGDLRILSCQNDESSFNGPSWVPDFRHRHLLSDAETKGFLPMYIESIGMGSKSRIRR